MADGPLPEHYEAESPVRNVLSSQQNNPVITWWQGLGKLATREDFPISAPPTGSASIGKAAS